MKRSEAIEIALENITDEDVALFATGMISREAFDIKERKANFYMLGSMGLVSSLGLGLALNTTRRVVVFDGDGSVLMDMGTMAMIGSEKPPNLVHIVLDNEAYDSTGGQPTISKAIELADVAGDVGYKSSTKVSKVEKLEQLLKSKISKEGPHFVLIKVLEKPDKSVKRVSLSPLQITERFKKFLSEK